MSQLLILILPVISSPGDSVGWTLYDLQRNGQTGYQVWYDGDAIHVDFMCAHEPDPFPDRNCCYNFKLGGVWFGDSMVASNRAGWITLGVKPSNNAAVCAYHMIAPGDIFRSWVAVDSAQGGYNSTEHPVLPQETSKELIWPNLAVDDQDNLHVTNYEYAGMTRSYYTRSTDGGLTWSDTMIVNPGINYTTQSTGVSADRFNAPGKIIIYWTQWTGEGSSGTAQHAQNVWYMISTDWGASWNSKINLTQYQSSDTMRAFCHVKGLFDKNGDPHLVWPTLLFKNTTPYLTSWIIHWSPSTGFSIVTGPHSMATYDPGPWRLPCDFPNLAVDRNNDYLYLTYVLNRDSDVSLFLVPNGEIMGKYSTNNGLTWISSALGDTGVNLTRTPTPGADSGECCDDEYLSMHPYIETIGGVKSLILSYLEDKDAGPIVDGYGKQTQNPYRVYVVPVESIIGVEERPAQKIDDLKIPGLVYGNLLRLSGINKHVNVKVLDILGREVLSQTVSPQKSYINLNNLKSGVYFLQFVEAKQGLHKIILLK